MRRSHLVCWHTRQRISSKVLLEVAAMLSSRAFQGGKLSMYTSYVFFSGQGFLRGSLKRSSSLCWIREQQREYSTVINNLPPPFPSIVYRYPFLRAMMRRRSFIGLFWKDYENTFFFFFLCLTFSRTFLRRNSNPRIYRLHFPFQFLSLAL